jgi:hypothetical protein
METGINELLLDQRRVHSLLGAVGPGKGSGAPPWYAPADANVNCIQVGDLANESTTISTVSELVALSGKHETDEILKVLLKNRRFKSSLVQLGPTVYPKQVKACPSLDEVKKRMVQDVFVLSVFSYSGYSFLGEFMHVYKGKLARESAVNDAQAVLKRALLCCNPTLSDKSYMRFAEFIMRMSAWEATLAASVLDETAKTLFPKWKAHFAPVPVENNFQHAEVYIGYNASGELSFTVRIRHELELRAATQGKGDKAVKGTTAAAATETLPPNVALELVYYREFVLSDSVIDAFLPAATIAGAPSGAGKAGQFVPPPPPPKRKKKASGDGAIEPDDIRVFLLITQKLDAAQLLAAEGAAAEGSQAAHPAGSDAGTDADQSAERSEEWVNTVNSASSDRNVSFCAELYGWGFDASHSMGLGTSTNKKLADAKTNETSILGGSGAVSAAEVDANIQELVHGPRRIPLDRLIAIERVRSVACSSTHTLLLTWMGSVFGCGENAEGALGTGDFVSR